VANWELFGGHLANDGKRPPTDEETGFDKSIDNWPSVAEKCSLLEKKEGFVGEEFE
jgi:hypothetical protein